MKSPYFSRTRLTEYLARETKLSSQARSDRSTTLTDALLHHHVHKVPYSILNCPARPKRGYHWPDTKRATILTVPSVITESIPMDLSVDEARAKLKNQFALYSGDKYAEGWNDLWNKGDFLPWDRLVPSPALADTLIHGDHLVGTAMLNDGTQKRRKRALVPGCGRGPDVLLLQSFGYDVIGLEISIKAVEAAAEHGKNTQDDYPVRDEKIGKGSRQFLHGDFYSDEWLEKAGLSKEDKFDLIYDYTFFCAMNPAMRPAWSKRMSELLAPTTFANLICLEFPSTKPVNAGGPPFSSPPKAYLEHLSHPGVDIPYTEEGEVRVNPLAEIGPGGLERLAHFHPPVAHSIGKDADGNVMDYISIWRHRK